mgnify:CR=1 FL=1
MNVRFEETMLHLRILEFSTLEKKINKNNKNIILMVMMMISHIESSLRQARLEAFIGLTMLVTYTKPWV